MPVFNNFKLQNVFFALNSRNLISTFDIEHGVVLFLSTDRMWWSSLPIDREAAEEEEEEEQEVEARNKGKRSASKVHTETRAHEEDLFKSSRLAREKKYLIKRGDCR